MEMANNLMRHHLESVAEKLEDIAKIALEWGRDLRLGHIKEAWRGMRRKARREARERAKSDEDDETDESTSNASKSTVEVRSSSNDGGSDSDDDDDDIEKEGGDDGNGGMEATSAETNQFIKTLIAQVGSRSMRLEFTSDYPRDIKDLLAIHASEIELSSSDIIPELIKQQLHLSETNVDAGTEQHGKKAKPKVGEKRKRETEPAEDKKSPPEKEQKTEPKESEK